MHHACATYFGLIFNFIFIFRVEILSMHVTKTKISQQINYQKENLRIHEKLIPTRIQNSYTELKQY